MICRRARAAAVLTAVALSMGAVAACGGEAAQNAGSTDGGSPAASAAGTPDTLPAGPDVATTGTTGTEVIVSSTTTAVSAPPRPTTASSAPRAPLPTKPAAPKAPASTPTTAARAQTPEQARWCPTAIESVRLLQALVTLTPADYGRVPAMIEVGRRSRDLAPAEIRSDMDVIVATMTVIADAIVAGQVTVSDVDATLALVDQRLGPGTAAATQAAFSRVVDYGLKVC